MALYPYPTSSKAPPPPGKTEFEILKASHKFLREDNEKGQPLSWDEQLATKYYDSLFREYAVCDLKHYKSGNFALRWRTEAEVLAGAGETSCGNTRCVHHAPGAPRPPPLSTLELPFAYAEHGETKSALVKTVLCERCFGKLMWKRRKEKAEAADGDAPAAGGVSVKREPEEEDAGPKRRRKQPREQHEGDGDQRRRKRNSRSRSPRAQGHRDEARRRHHPAGSSPVRLFLNRAELDTDGTNTRRSDLD
ncbi:folate-sensitive fragile site protein Fra10Ac1-domain-containing protein [Mycena sp. CBHHK59/15]|nr:folate-sensitive fragile site protein Fra10Ac1-domain-containing protein [Mycena sp. CBHHK59/15]